MTNEPSCNDTAAGRRIVRLRGQTGIMSDRLRWVPQFFHEGGVNARRSLYGREDDQWAYQPLPCRLLAANRCQPVLLL
jgi:hypothetical protein